MLLITKASLALCGPIFVNLFYIVYNSRVQCQMHATTAGSFNFTPEVETTYGPVRGKTIKLATNKSVDLYLGIPFATAARFEAPTAPEPWKTTLNAIKYGMLCPQAVVGLTNFTAFDTDMAEDCLYINIFVPSHKSTDSELFPVMHWIHGGAYVLGSGDQPDPSVHASEGRVIVVGSNYRLGALGFLATGEKGLRGNYAMLDQIEAMKWVQENIERFGGDPGKVTKFGRSAGGMSVGLLMLSPLAHGLYHNVILQSGTAASPFAALEMYEARERATTFASLLGCRDVLKLKECLMSKTLREIMLAQGRMPLGYLMQAPWAPVVDGYFLRDLPIRLLKQGKFNRTNVLTGVTRENGVALFIDVPGVVNAVPGINEGLDSNMFVRSMKRIKWIRNQTERTLNSIIFQYTDWSHPNDPIRARKSFLDANSDAMFKAPMIISAQSFSKRNLNTYVYQLEYAPTEGRLSDLPSWWGVYHSADAVFVFGMPLTSRNSSSDRTDVKFSKEIIKMWTNFARTGNPTPANSSGAFKWPRYTLETQQYVSLKPRIEVKSRLLAKKIIFWNEYLSAQESEEKLTQPPPLKSTQKPTTKDGRDAIIRDLIIGMAVLGVFLLVVVALFIFREQKRIYIRAKNSELEYIY